MAGVAEQRKQWHEADPAPSASLAPAIADEPAPVFEVAERPAPARRLGPVLITAALLLLALAWIAALAVGVALASPPGGPSPLRIAAWIGLGSGPLALIVLLALLLLRTGRLQAKAYARAAGALRVESAALAELVEGLQRRIEAARTGLADEGATLGALGESAARRLAQAGASLRADAAAVATTAATLDESAAAARVDLGVLLADLPRAEALTASLTERLRAVGDETVARADALAERIAALEAGTRAADQASTGAARRLAAELERVENSAAAADRRIGEAAAQLGQASTAALTGSADALDQVRRGVDAQSAALAAIVLNAQGTLDRSGNDAAIDLDQRLATLARTIEAMDARLRGHEGAATTLIGQIDQALAAVETRFQALGDVGAEQTADLAEAIVTLAGHADQIDRALGQGNAHAESLLARAAQLRGHVEASGGVLGETIPAALARLRLHAEQGLKAINDAAPRADDLAATVARVAERLGEADVAIDRQQGALAALGGAAEARLADLTQQADAFHALLARTDAELRGLAEGASSQLVDALLRVRETAAQAAERARETLAAAIPAAAAQLGEEAARAMAASLKGVGQAEIAAVGGASAQAIEAARAAAERLSRQLAAIADTSTAIEARATAQDEQNFARQVGLLIEALNSSAIDIAKIFSNEPTDTAWAAYLKGDRGIFTRRAVTLLGATDARTIAARYGDDIEFREQVNRYVHDFEAMLRRVLAVREGAPMAVTMLSSDTGKLYAAITQAIEKVRR